MRSLERSFAANPILESRRERCVRMLYRVIEIPQDVPIANDARSLTLPSNEEDERNARAKLPLIQRQLAAIAHEPCTPRIVVEVLKTIATSTQRVLRMRDSQRKRSTLHRLSLECPRHVSQDGP